MTTHKMPASLAAAGRGDMDVFKGHLGPRMDFVFHD
jgi:hypothetical protein